MERKKEKERVKKEIQTMKTIVKEKTQKGDKIERKKKRGKEKRQEEEEEKENSNRQATVLRVKNDRLTVDNILLYLFPFVCSHYCYCCSFYGYVTPNLSCPLRLE